MKNGVKIYGGFDPQNNIKTLSDSRIMPGNGNQGTILDGKNERPVIWNDFEGAPALTGTSVFWMGLRLLALAVSTRGVFITKTHPYFQKHTHSRKQYGWYL